MSVDLAELLALPAAERLQIAEALWDSIASSQTELPVTDWQKAELDRRKAEHLAHPSAEMTWQEAKARMLQDRG